MLQILGKSTSINVRKVAAHTDPELIAAGVSNWNRHMAMLDGQLQRTGAFVTGGRFTLADFLAQGRNGVP